MRKALRYLLNVAISLDQFGNVALGGAPDETISSRIGRIKKHYGGKIPWWRPATKTVDALMNVIDKDHCAKSIEFDELEQTRRESVIDGDKGT
jgi:hypothetical protein